MTPLKVALALALLLLPAPAARADSCLEVLEVDRYVLVGMGSARGPLPPRAGTVEAVIPACIDDDDRDVVAHRLKGLPPTVAVEHEGDVYLGTGAMTAVRGHPLRGQVGARAPRRRRCRPRSEPLTGAAVEAGPFGLGLPDGGDRPLWLHADGRTRITNRPAYQPVVDGQRVSVAVSRCSRGLFADRITFVGKTLAPEREPWEPPGWTIGLAVAVVAVALCRRARRA